jgi:hypothetical protein
MPKKRVRVITKKQKVTELGAKLSTSLEQVVREPTFNTRTRQSRSFPLALPFIQERTTTQQKETKPQERAQSETSSETREAFSYDRPSGTGARNDGTYRVPGATDQQDNQLYRAKTDEQQGIEKDRQDRFNPVQSDTNRLRDTNVLSQQKQQDRYQGSSQTYQSTTQNEKKNTKELDRSRF